jgi:GTP cyclohydrolase I
MEALFRQIIQELGEDPEREGLIDTPARATRAFASLTRGYALTPREVIGRAIFESPNDEMVIVTNIELYSLCEHHLLPFFGHCHVGYLPRGKVIGLSKIARVVEVFSRRLQIQENMTREIAESIMEVVEPHGVGVVVEARHLCMMMRGVEKQNSRMVTSCMLGDFRADPRTRAEFLDLIRQ